MNRVIVAGVGVVPFSREADGFAIDEGATRAALMALRDAGMSYKEIQMGFCANLYQGAVAPLVFYSLAKTGIPITHVEIACASATRAIQQAAHLIEEGACDACLVVGVERMPKGLVPMPIDPAALSSGHEMTCDMLMGLITMPAAYAYKATRYMEQYGAKAEYFAKVSVKSHKNALLNPNAVYQKPVSLDEVMASRMIAYPITLYQCCPNANGAAAVVLVSEKTVVQQSKKVYLTGWGAASMRYQPDNPIESYLSDGDTRLAANNAYKKAGMGPEDVEVVQIHDAFAPGEIFQLEALGLCPEGEAGQFVWEGHTELEGRLPVNTDGGLISCGHPVGASGARMVAEIVWQLRGQAGGRQVGKNGTPKVGLVQNSGLGATNVLLFQV